MLQSWKPRKCHQFSSCWGKSHQWLTPRRPPNISHMNNIRSPNLPRCIHGLLGVQAFLEQLLLLVQLRPVWALSTCSLSTWTTSLISAACRSAATALAFSERSAFSPWSCCSCPQACSASRSPLRFPSVPLLKEHAEHHSLLSPPAASHIIWYHAGTRDCLAAIVSSSPAAAARLSSRPREQLVVWL